jgi:GNAT superfamily N-acetyltransferase
MTKKRRTIPQNKTTPAIAPSEVAVKIARPEDREILIQMFFNLLKFLDPCEHDMLPTKENAEFMVDKFFVPAASRSEAILIAWDGSKPVGALFWPIQIPTYRSRWKTAYGYGTYLEEGYRGKRLSNALFQEAIKISKNKGVQRVIGTILEDNKRAQKVTEKLGFRCFGKMYYLDTENYNPFDLLFTKD